MSLALHAQKVYLAEESEKRKAQEAERKKMEAKRDDIIHIATKSFDAWLRTGPTTMKIPTIDIELEAVPSYGGQGVIGNLPAQVIFLVEGMRFKVEGEYPVYEGAQPWGVSVEAIPMHEGKAQTHLEGWFKVRNVAGLGHLIDRNRVKRYDL